MSSTYTPHILTFKADAAISKGMAVKIGTDKDHVAKAAATTDKCIGVAQNAATAAEDKVEVAMPGGGGKVLAKTTFVAGDLLGPNADGTLQKVASASDRYIAMALEDASANDLCAAHIVAGQATASES